MRQVKCANCGRTQVIQKMADVQGQAMTPFERQRQRWFYLDKLDIVLCGGSLRKDGVDDGKDWCQHMHYDNNRAAYERLRDNQVMEIFLPGITGTVPKAVEKHVLEVEDGSGIEGSGA